jgi:DNA-binding NarL/FixJ family response regulator
MAAEPHTRGPIRTLVVDDHRLIREGVRAVLPDREFAIVGEAATAERAIELADQLQPDVVLLDLGLPDADGVAACAEILSRAPQTQVVILSARCDALSVRGATSAGALAYLLKGAEDLDLADSLRRVVAGESVLDPRAARVLLGPPRARGELTRQELNAVRLAAEGLTNREIAERLRVSPHTAKEYLSAAMHKLGEPSRVRLVMRAVRDGLLLPPDGGQPTASRTNSDPV